MFKQPVYTGTVRHRRFKHKHHEFNYKVLMFCFDLGNIEQTFKTIKQVSVEKFNWFSFYRENYLSSVNETLDECARQLVASKCDIYPKGKIYLLTQLSCMNYCFNPISLYFILNETNENLAFLIIEVTNTPWGERHQYVLNSPIHKTNGTYQFQFIKELHVSPFMSMNYQYQFNLKLTKHKILVHMENKINGEKDFDATLVLAPASSMYKAFLRHPLTTYQISVAIYWQAFKLWMKGVPFHAHPRGKKGD